MTIGERPNESLENHIPCPNCNGTLCFVGVKDGENYFKCCLCMKEFTGYEVNHGGIKRKKSLKR